MIMSVNFSVLIYKCKRIRVNLLALTKPISLTYEWSYLFIY